MFTSLQTGWNRFARRLYFYPAEMTVKGFHDVTAVESCGAGAGVQHFYNCAATVARSTNHSAAKKHRRWTFFFHHKKNVWRDSLFWTNGLHVWDALIFLSRFLKLKKEKKTQAADFFLKIAAQKTSKKRIWMSRPTLFPWPNFSGDCERDIVNVLPKSQELIVAFPSWKKQLCFNHLK